MLGKFNITSILPTAQHREKFQSILDTYEHFYDFITRHCPGYLHIVDAIGQPSYFGKCTNEIYENIRLSPDLRLGTNSSLYDACINNSRSWYSGSVSTSFSDVYYIDEDYDISIIALNNGKISDDDKQKLNNSKKKE